MQIGFDPFKVVGLSYRHKIPPPGVEMVSLCPALSQKWVCDAFQKYRTKSDEYELLPRFPNRTYHIYQSFPGMSHKPQVLRPTKHIDFKNT